MNEVLVKQQPDKLKESSPLWFTIVLNILKVAVWVLGVHFFYNAAFSIHGEMSVKEIEMYQVLMSTDKPYQVIILKTAGTMIALIGMLKVVGWLLDWNGVRALKKKIRAWEAYQE